jgi:hypothetical protein
MGDVARVLSTCNETLLQSLMHDRLVLEVCENVHFHWRNVRLEMSTSDAARMINVCWRLTKLMPLLEKTVVAVPLASICPYDGSHRRISDEEFENDSPAATAEHKAGVAWMVEQMKAGQRPRPIAVCAAWTDSFPRTADWQPGNIWQRLDGFKRYMAHRTLGLPAIDCTLVADYQPGCQHGLRPFLEPGEKLHRRFDKAFFLTTQAHQLSLVEADKQRYLENQVELLTNGTIHVHLGDTRLEFTREEFIAFAGLIGDARSCLGLGSSATPVGVVTQGGAA